MEMQLEGGGRLGRQLKPEPMAASAFGALLLHGGLAATLLIYGYLGGLFHHNQWGDAGASGAIQVSLVTSALPLPSDQKPNDNVLATDTPSEAPAEPAAKEKQAVDDSAIAISGKQVKPQQQTIARVPQSQVKPPQDNKAKYGEQGGSSIARNTQPAAATVITVGHTSIGDVDFGSKYGWYVNNMNQKVSQNWYSQEVNSSTMKGSRVYLIFTIHRDGTVSDVKFAQGSGSPTLDRSCLRAVQRVDSLGALPSTYGMSSLNVSYYCEY
ncbi:MAG: TonB family protein [Terracidiphilus sp.]